MLLVFMVTHTDTTDIKQLQIHAAAQFFYSRTAAAGGIVVLTNRPELVLGQYPADFPLFIASDPMVFLRSKKTLAATMPDVPFITSLSLDKEFLEDKLLVCVDYLDNPSLGPGFMVRWLVAYLSRVALLSITSTDTTRGWQLPDLRRMLAANRTVLSGKAKRLTDSSRKDQLVAISGQLTDVKRHTYPTLPVLAILHIFNEQDVIASTISHLLDQGLDVHIIDNWSTDDTYSIVESLAATSSRITYERFPNTPNNAFELEKMLVRVAAVAREKEQYSWIVLNDADEIRWSPWEGVTLQEAISFIDSVCYNAIDYTVFNFVPTEEGFDESHTLKDFFKYGEFSGISGHFVQIKTWKNVPGAELAPSGGHRVAFADQEVFPLKFLLGHYPIRSTKHGLAKIFKERKSRYSKEERRKGWHVHYDDIDKSTSFLGDKKNLVNFSDKAFAQNFIFERTSGIGIVREKE